MDRIEDQPAPIPQPERVPVWQLVIADYTKEMASGNVTDEVADPVDALVLADMAERDRLGRERYGTPLTTGNGRDHLVDAYQEALDGAVYMRAWLEEHKPDDGDRARMRSARYQMRRTYLEQLRVLWNLRRLIMELAS